MFGTPRPAHQRHWTAIAIGIAGVVVSYTVMLVYNGTAIGAPAVRCTASGIGSGTVH